MTSTLSGAVFSANGSGRDKCSMFAANRCGSARNSLALASTVSRSTRAKACGVS